ncbi:glycosyltransferase family 2 protein [Endozoicomonas sp.]|uniref:glycosyltransferase family 2 protein n=1 Tax=Endozoicomonas sp. TaxID=1892382 RepID=UPI003AF6A155
MKISIITAVYNNQHTLRSTLESIISQAYKNIEIIIIDGASTDNTINILQEFSEHISVLISEPDNGIYDALNKGIALATGDVIGFMHSDDLFFDHSSLLRIKDSFDDSSIDAVYGDLIYVEKENTNQIVRYWRSNEFDQNMLSKGWMPPHPTFYMKRRFYEKYGGFDLQYRISADYDSMLRYLLTPDIHVRYIPEVLVRMRVGGISNRSLGNMLLKSQEDYQVIKHHNIGGINTLLMKNFSKIPQFFSR